MRRMLEVPGRHARARASVRSCALACALLVFGAAGARAQSDLPPALEAIIAGIFTPPNAFKAASLVAEILSIADGVTPTPSPSPSATATMTVTATVTQTPTLRACPQKTAAIEVEIDNRSAAIPAVVHLSGARSEGGCLGGEGAETYDVVANCPQGVSVCTIVSGLRPGTWVHQIEVTAPALGQVQYRRALLVAGSTPDRLSHTVFAGVSTVSTTADSGTGSWRNLIANAAMPSKPLLIQFSPVAFPPGVPTTVLLRSAAPSLTANDVTVDGIDATGERGNRIIDAGGLATPAMTITGARNHVIGMRLRNAGANDRDVLSISGAAAKGNLIESSIVDTAASADAIGVDTQAGGSFTDVNIIRDCEVFGAFDKGVKVTTGSFARVEISHVHDNRNGGIQAALGGHLQVINNLVEDNRGSTAQNGISVLGADDNGGEVSFSELFTRGNISRRNGASGIAVRVGASASIRDDYYAVNGTSGIRVFNDVGPAATADVQGSSAVCNGGDGAVVANTSFADFGGGALESPGNNAFTQNNLPEGFENFRNSTGSLISAINNQWEHCGNGTTCNDSAIERLDLNDDGLNTDISPAQAHRNLMPVISSVFPTRGHRGDLLRIYGSGFDVIDGHFAENRCAEVAARNTCVPVRGNCVQINGAAAPVEAVTPTMIIAHWPFTCTEPTQLIVKVDQGPDVVTSEPIAVCE